MIEKLLKAPTQMATAASCAPLEHKMRIHISLK